MIHAARWSDPVPANDERLPPANSGAGVQDDNAPRAGGPLRSTITLPATADQIAEARRFVAGLDANEALAADAVLCLSEVATNAVLHSNSRSAGGWFTVSAELYGDGSLRIKVEDQGGRWLERPKPEAQQHLGLAIVRSLASAWGIENDGPDRRIVWFELRPVATALPSAA